MHVNKIKIKRSIREVKHHVTSNDFNGKREFVPRDQVSPFTLLVVYCSFFNIETRGTFRQVPTRRIRLFFVKCAYSDLRDNMKRQTDPYGKAMKK